MSRPPHLLFDYSERAGEADATNDDLNHGGPVGRSLAVLFRDHWSRLWPKHVWHPSDPHFAPERTLAAQRARRRAHDQ
jgi:hypothetical protein